LEARRINLEKYLQALLTHPHIFQSSEVRSFFDPEGNINVRQMKRNDPESFLLPPPPPNVKIPQYLILREYEENQEEQNKQQEEKEEQESKILELEPTITSKKVEKNSSIQSNGEESVELENILEKQKAKDDLKKKNNDLTFVLPLLNSIKDDLEYLTCLKKELASAKEVKESLQIFETKRERTESTVAALKKEKSILLLMAKHKSVESSSDLKNYLTVCLEQIRKGLEWQFAKEEDMLEDLFSKLDDSIESKVKKFEEEAEEIASQAFYAVDIEKKELEVRFSQLIKMVMDELGLLEVSKDDQNADVIIRLRKVQAYLKEVFVNLSSK